MQAETITCLIIDDDPFIRELLRDKIEQYLPDVSILGTASSGKEGLEKIKFHTPELVFLDVEMDDMTGFEMLSKLKDIPFQIIFITAFSHYAIKAIRFNALDYLVKPIDLGELRSAVRRYKSRKKEAPKANPIHQALINLKIPNASDQTLVLHTQEGELKLVLNQIIRIEGERNYSVIHLGDGKKKLATKTLGEMEEILSDKGFFRCHKSHVINIHHIKSFHTSSVILLTGDTPIPISRRKKEAFHAWYNAVAS